MLEWENTRLNGVPRAWRLLDELRRQWTDVREGRFPDDLPEHGARFLESLEPRIEVIVASGEALAASLETEIRERLPDPFDVRILVAEGREYYPLKNAAAADARGDLLLFLDSDVVPEPGWLAHLVGTLGRSDVDVVSGQTFVAPRDLVSRAFALGWTYELRAPAGELLRPDKFYANNLLFRAAAFRPGGFPPIGARTRGASSRLGAELRARGIAIWENRAAGVDHPPPSGLGHLIVRAIAHGRDHYMKESEQRHAAGLARSVGIAGERFATSVRRTLRDGRRIGLRPWQVPAAILISATYYGWFALGGVVTHVAPGVARRRFRV